ncbi:MAG: c-type cytochrome [Gammaproteobacteria bacterium]|nr:c-type cytochrome [Gammaproteobacteria bacterium]
MNAKWLIAPIAAAALFVSGQASADLDLAKKSGCLACHGIDKKIVGPSWHDIAAKYKDDTGARDLLIDKVKKGGKGTWGSAPMPPFSPRVSDANIEKLVDFILAL